MMNIDSLEYWDEPPANAAPRWFQDRGRAFERIIVKLLEKEGLNPRGSMRPDGEEVDGSFVLGERIFLFEAKWRAKPIPASDLYAFKGKVDGKLLGTLGIFISMSGYSDDAIDALKVGKDINLILFTAKDFRLCAQGMFTFTEALRKKLRYAAEEGQPYFPLASDESVTQKFAEKITPEMTGDINVPGHQSNNAWDIVVEGQSDEAGLHIVFERLELKSKVRFWMAGGQLGVLSLVRRLRESGHKNVAALIEPDMPQKLVEELRQEFQRDEGSLVVIRPNVEEWLENACDVDDMVVLMMATSNRAKAVRRFATHANLDRLIASNHGFAALTRRVGGR